ncbi:MAG TPA: aldo/keto reductase [Candidatus Latescibacteria bacterium]|jgi:aryl-alcohol dehydrogenase-like predicted oxidoreductase|nr:aldo/keto reductase [Candidatus Latescibacterota bacterium]HCV22009.1 aldo/keto reductase [Candidatus Latescibacterota bacterium]
MRYRDFGRTGWQVSTIGLGTWNIGNQWGALDDKTAWATVRAAYDHGMNLFDAAESYGVPNGLSEERLGVAMAGFRHNVYVVSKIGNWGARTGQAVPKTTVDMIRLCAHASLHRLRTDYHDVLLCHDGGIEDPSVYLEGFKALQKEGRLRHYGISTNDLDVLKRFNHEGGCKVVQVDYSLVNRTPEAELLPYCLAQGIAVMVRGPLARGLLSGRYTKESRFDDEVRSIYNVGGDARDTFETRMDTVDQIRELVEPAQMVSTALQYVISQPTLPVAIPGAKSPEQAEMNAAAGADTLSEEEVARLQV